MRHDIRAYREALMARLGLTPIFPVWMRDTPRFVGEFIALGFRAVVVSIDPTRLDPGFAGRTIDASFVSDLPAGVDPCGENGEFHSFVFDGPGFAAPIGFAVGRRSFDDQLCYQAVTADLSGLSAAAEEAAFR